MSRIYATVKLHKQNSPIISTVGSPTYKLSGFIAKILKALSNNATFNIKDSSQLAEQLK